MKPTLIVFSCWLWMMPLCRADDVVVCDPTHPLVPNAVTRFETSIDPVGLRGRSGFLIWMAPNNTMPSDEQAKMRTLRSQLDALKGVPMTSWICTDSDADGLLDAVREMTQTEKDAIEAPQIAERNRINALMNERMSLEIDVDAAISSWATLTTAEKTDALKKSMRLNRVYRLLQSP